MTLIGEQGFLPVMLFEGLPGVYQVGQKEVYESGHLLVKELLPFM